MFKQQYLLPKLEIALFSYSVIKLKFFKNVVLQKNKSADCSTTKGKLRSSGKRSFLVSEDDFSIELIWRDFSGSKTFSLVAAWMYKKANRNRSKIFYLVF